MKLSDRKKLIEQLETDAIATNTGYVEVPLFQFSEIIAMLKEQEAVEPIISESYRTNSGRMSRRKAWCGACGIGINFDAKFCDRCGKAVKWE